MICLSEEDLVLSIFDQTERSSAVIGQTDFSDTSPDPTPVIVSSLSNIFDSALVVTALEDPANPRDDCYRKAHQLVMASPAVNADTKRFIRQIQEFRSRVSFDPQENAFRKDECLDFLNAFDCFMFGFFKNSPTVARLTGGGKVSGNFVSFRNIVEKLLKKEMLANKNRTSSEDIAVQLAVTNKLLERILEENSALNSKVDELTRKIDALSHLKGGSP